MFFYACLYVRVLISNCLFNTQYNATSQALGPHQRGNDGWMSVSSPNSLADVHWLHVGSQNGASRIDKEKRNVFVKGRIQDVRKQFQVGPIIVKNKNTRHQNSVFGNMYWRAKQAHLVVRQMSVSAAHTTMHKTSEISTHV